ncbi:MAG: LysE family translocator [Candidatus Thermoplasmatota archaeon]|jgi:threonine/homoserine/homoserine lactone efflux protein|nr:LysE family translocator [Candidatus Thermoplasmatota archaeon]MEC8216829.1 LysE family translocator [Candidatus Thermoplasmatota archaeon]MEC8446636.1 LysE family translocator [Candidatus Thermoplasmatota archaeon]MEC9138108.1 LysE family translocator [Candidatus Thermoplasmatota archaeon]|tara:strand:+ start:3507 stop:4118 length:612 start_codon:yes stop_codon:yes gene_type:complete
MDLTTILALSFVCAMGAMSPGPSLAVILRNTISGGRLQGVMTGVGHGLGFGMYALLAVTGLSALLIAHESFFLFLQWSGALVLLWLSYDMLTYIPSDGNDDHSIDNRRGFIEGFLISFLNPKILVFLVAVFSQFIDPQMSQSEKILMAILAGLIDTTWYVLVAAILAGTPLIDFFRSNSLIIDRVIGLVLSLLALALVVRTFV